MVSGDDDRLRSLGGCRRAGLLPCVRQQFGDAFHRVVGQPGDQVDEVGLGIDAGEPAVFHHGEQSGQARPGLGVSDLQPVLRTELERPDGLLDQVVFDPRARFAQAAQQRGLLPEQITQGLAEPGFRRRARDRNHRIGEEFLDRLSAVRTAPRAINPSKLAHFESTIPGAL